MGADNYTKCPNCIRKAEEKKDVTKEIVGNDLREDYEVGFIEGDFYIFYNARCSKCGFTFKYEKKNGEEAT